MGCSLLLCSCKEKMFLFEKWLPRETLPPIITPMEMWKYLPLERDSYEESLELVGIKQPHYREGKANLKHHLLAVSLPGLCSFKYISDQMPSPS